MFVFLDKIPINLNIQSSDGVFFQLKLFVLFEIRPVFAACLNRIYPVNFIVIQENRVPIITCWQRKCVIVPNHATAVNHTIEITSLVPTTKMYTQKPKSRNCKWQEKITALTLLQKQKVKSEKKQKLNV